MIIDTMTKTEVMLSLLKEFKEEIVPLYSQANKELGKTTLPRVQRTGKTENISKDKESTGHNVFHIIYKITKDGYSMNAYCEFLWHGKYCYATFFTDNSVVVYQRHCLERYAERVLNKDVAPDMVFKKYLLDKQDGAFQISLQAPNRERCQFFGLADALFLGDYDEPTKDNLNVNLHWYNTCISLKETHATQSGILHSLAMMQKYVKELGFNPLDTYLSKEQKKRLKDVRISETKSVSYIEFLKRTYMLHQLQLSLNFPWIYLYINDINSRMERISHELEKYGINTSSLSPYGKEVGFAIKGEIDYKG